MAKSLWSARRRRSLAGCWGSDALEPRAMLTPIMVHTEPAPGGAVNLTVTEFDPDDAASGVFAPTPGVGGVALFTNNPDGFSVDGGPAQPSPTFAAINNLTWNLGGGNDGFWLQDVSLNNLKIRETATTTGQSFDVIRSIGAPVHLGNVSVESAQSWDFNLDAHTQPMTMASLSLKATTPVSTFFMESSTFASVNILGDFNYTDLGASASTSMFLFRDSFNNSVMNVGGNVNLKLGDGGNNIGLVLSAGGNVSVTTGSGFDNVGVAGSVIGGSVFINTGAGNGQVNVQGLSAPLQVHGSVAIVTGQQTDTVSVSNIVIGGSLLIGVGGSDSTDLGYGPNNTVLIGNAEIDGDTLIQSSGAALVVIYANNSHTTRFHGSVAILLASGTIDTTYFPVDPTSQIVFDQFQLYVGLKQQITVKYASNVVYNPHKLLLVNAVLA